MTTLLDQATEYADRFRWRVLPIWPAHDGRCACGKVDCASPAKHPVGRLVPNGLHGATRDVRTLRHWWRLMPNANVGVRTGAVSGFVVLDIDPRHGGDDSLALMQEVCGKLPDTVESLTGSGGRHLLFRHPERMVPNKVALAPGVDIRGDGGYIVAPPSLHVAGQHYAWDLMSGPDSAMADMPTWLLESIDGVRGVVGEQPQGRSSKVADALNSRPGEGGRSAAFTTFMGYLARRVPQDIGIAIAHCWNDALSQPWDDAEIDKRAPTFWKYADSYADETPERSLEEALGL